MAKDRVFVSFDWENDRNYKNALLMWDANDSFDFEFGDNTPTEIQSDDIGRIKAALTAKINKSTHTLVIVGKEANKQHADHVEIGYKNWINFEVHQSVGVTKIRVMKLDKDYTDPEELKDQVYKWLAGFTLANVKALLEA
jgi:hypothetical protein